MKKKYVEPVMIVDDFTVSETIAKCQFTYETTFSAQMKHSGNQSCHNGTEDRFFDDPADTQVGPPWDRKDLEYYHWNLINQAFEGNVDVNGDGNLEGRCFTSAFAQKYGTGVCQDLSAENMTFTKNAYDSTGILVAACTKGEGSEGVNPLQNS